MEGLLLAYAADPNLARNLGWVLEQRSVRYEVEDRLVLFGVLPERRLQLMLSLREALNPVERKLIRIGPGQLSQIFAAPDLDTYTEILETEWFDSALAGEQFVIYYQPIVDVTASRAVAYECLIRLEGDRIYNGGEIINAAAIRGRIVDFDSYARVHTIQSARAQHRPGSRIFLNFFPSAVYDPSVCLQSTIEAAREMGFQPDELVFEIIECDPITNLAHTRSICEFLRGRGFRFAIDDLGIGTNTLDMILELKPDYIKVDKSVIWNLCDQPKREFLTRAIAMAGDVGAQVIAEGIESLPQARDVRALGISLMQGFGFGKPSPIMRYQSPAMANSELSKLAGALTSSSRPAPALARASASRTRRTRP
jgi:EAL domain-containing protein (putative c-di-GMP-specific phosphodiesterase class I)